MSPNSVEKQFYADRPWHTLLNLYWPERRWVWLAMERLMQGRTTFIIAHRQAVLRRADRLVFLENGVMVKQTAVAGPA